MLDASKDKEVEAIEAAECAANGCCSLTPPNKLLHELFTHHHHQMYHFSETS